MGASEGFLGWIAYLGAANAGIPLSIIVKNYGWEVRRMAFLFWSLAGAGWEVSGDAAAYTLLLIRDQCRSLGGSCLIMLQRMTFSFWRGTSASRWWEVSDDAAARVLCRIYGCQGPDCPSASQV